MQGPRARGWTRRRAGWWFRCEALLQAEEILWLRIALAAAHRAGAEASARVRQWEDLGFT